MNEDEAVHILCDNQSAEAVLKSPRTTEVSKQRVALGEVQIQHVPTARQVADILTKPLERIKFEAGRAALGVKAWGKIDSS
jgi:hypothetical protein